MEHVGRPLTKRPRAPIACNDCRTSKSKCDGQTPTCERCVKHGLQCVYSDTGRDKRMSRQTERKANLDLRNRVRELEAKLAASSQNASQAPDAQRQDDDASVQAIANANPSEAEVSRRQPSHRGSLDAISRHSARASSTAESPVDVLAAGVFDHPSAGYICYFGATSNHALFWSLTASIANLGHRSSRLYQEPLRPGQAFGGPAQLPIPAASVSSNECDRDHRRRLLPARDSAVKWITHFFDTVGAVLPYVSEPVLLDSLDTIEKTADAQQPSTRALEALLNIVFAHALSTLEEGSPEPFYRRTLGLLDPKTLYVSSLELLQTLLLLSIYQQNSQRSTESWTTHSLAVKTSYQLGIHAPSLYEFVRVQEKELRSRLWFAVVNQDRMLSTALGQPCLVPLQHVRMDITEMLVTLRQNRTVEMSYSKENLTYFRNLIELHEIMGNTMDTIHGSNISPSRRLPLTDLVAKTLDLSLQLGQWRTTNVPFGLLGSNIDFSTWSPSAFEAERNAILISIFYYRTVMLVHGSLLMFALELATNGSAEISSAIIQDTIRSLLKTNYVAVTEFHHIIRGILQYQRAFLKRNAIWWTCNYGALTLCLHLFGHWVAANSAEANFVALGMDAAKLEGQLREGLDTLKSIGVGSAMSVKAHRCLHRHLHFLTSAPSVVTESNRQQEEVALIPDRMRDYHGPQFFPTDGHHHEGNADFPPNLATDWFGDLNVHDFMGADPLGLELGVSDFDATGLI